ncbi:hypothetical protein [Coxiella-like endosymbiont of Rhipicephalus sanguineus]|nr:hypothetical protein [Coxiella-like endosymbiont of Rhipicephalus sanguineus]
MFAMELSQLRHAINEANKSGSNYTGVPDKKFVPATGSFKS